MTAPSADPTPTALSEQSEPRELAADDYVEKVIALRSEVAARSRGSLDAVPEAIAEIEAVTRRYTASLIQESLRNARTHPNDKLVLVDDVAWARKRLSSGAGGAGTAVLVCTTLGGVALGMGGPMIILPVVRGTVATLTEGELALGGGLSIIGAVLLTIGFVLAARRR